MQGQADESTSCRPTGDNHLEKGLNGQVISQDARLGGVNLSTEREKERVRARKNGSDVSICEDADISPSLTLA